MHQAATSAPQLRRNRERRLLRSRCGAGAALVAVTLVGCGAHRLEGTDPGVLQRTQLAFLENGATLRTDVMATLGDPSSTYEADRIATYRLDGDLRADHRSQSGRWSDTRYSLVVVFDESDVMVGHSLVRVR